MTPPGWGALHGGPHLAGPLLAGSLKSLNIPAIYVDLNQECTNLLGQKITEVQILEALVEDDISSALNDLYYSVEDDLSNKSKKFDGDWSLHSGFHYTEVNPTIPVEVHQVINSVRPDESYIANRLQELFENGVNKLGISITVLDQLIPSLQIARISKSIDPSVEIIVGGNVVTRLDNRLSEVLWVRELFDHFVTFEGDQKLLELLDTPLIAKESNNLTQIGSFNPDFESVVSDSYWGSNYLTTMLVKGCYYGKCTFCDIPYGWNRSGYAGNIEPDTLVKHIGQQIEERGAKNWKFIEEALHPTYTKSFAKLVLQNSFEIQWEGYARLDLPWADSNFLNLVRSAGLRKLYFGLEITPNSENRKLLNKNDEIDCVNILRACNEAGILVHLFCMVGYPGTNLEDAVQTIEFLMEHENLIDTIDLFPFEYALHTKIDGIQRKNANPWSLSTAFTGDDLPLSHEDNQEIAGLLDERLMAHNSKWLHPLYRMVSPWAAQS